MNRLTTVLTAAALVVGVGGAARADAPEQPVCYRTDSGWSLVSYDQATELGAALGTGVMPLNGSCQALAGGALVLTPVDPVDPPEAKPAALPLVRYVEPTCRRPRGRVTVEFVAPGVRFIGTRGMNAQHEYSLKQFRKKRFKPGAEIQWYAESRPGHYILVGDSSASSFGESHRFAKPRGCKR
ncbi:hypothetical protein [Mumia sp. DW29H23]|uniref:hypothetical protein n=1 Tax=Mumia sp. DW29H23 TaxID=3421241 RepID=UPI003D69505A